MRRAPAIPTNGVPRMSKAMRGAVALCLAVACLIMLPALAQPLEGGRERVSYMVGMDVSQSLQPVAPDIDLDAFARAVAHVFEGGGPLLDDATSEATRLVMAMRA